MISQPARSVRSLVLIVAIAFGVSACSSQQPAQHLPKVQSGSIVKPGNRAVVGERAAAIALQQVGVPYRYGGSSPSGFDCSGLVHYSYANAGKSIPRTTTGLWANLIPIESHRMRVGDLLFFSIAGKMSHVGMYLGNGRFVHAPKSGRVVSIESLESDYYRRALIRAGRPR
jgi:cell wall-associated NlpC family hydrolase